MERDISICCSTHKRRMVMSSHIQRVVRAVDQLKSPSQLSTIVSSRDKLNGQTPPTVVSRCRVRAPSRPLLAYIIWPRSIKLYLLRHNVRGPRGEGGGVARVVSTHHSQLCTQRSDARFTYRTTTRQSKHERYKVPNPNDCNLKVSVMLCTAHMHAPCVSKEPKNERAREREQVYGAHLNAAQEGTLLSIAK